MIPTVGVPSPVGGDSRATCELGQLVRARFEEWLCPTTVGPGRPTTIRNTVCVYCCVLCNRCVLDADDDVYDLLTDFLLTDDATGDVTIG